MVDGKELKICTHTFERICKCTSRNISVQEIPSGRGMSEEGERPVGEGEAA